MTTRKINKSNNKGKDPFEIENEGIYTGDYKTKSGKKVRHGRGIMEYNQNTSLAYKRYNGEWVNGKMNGLGTMTYLSGEIYSGNWIDGQMHGNGEWTYPDPPAPTVFSSVNLELFFPEEKGMGYKVYNGRWVNGKKEGNGFMLFIDGSKYYGDWTNGKMTGNGEMKYEQNPNQYLKYNGDWHEGKKQGEGVMHFLDGRIYNGQWEEDRPLLENNDWSLEGNWENQTWMDIDWNLIRNKYVNEDTLDTLFDISSKRVNSVMDGKLQECVVCTGQLVNNETHGDVFALDKNGILEEPIKCGHKFHKQCIYNWIKTSKKNTCPLCRSIIAKIRLANPENEVTTGGKKKYKSTRKQNKKIRRYTRKTK